ncbi:disulfide reductase [candidate division MSBL1 archaeon SCGC-AAA259D14]|uniref:CoB--CoM heterodisulfide reductase iron-sulfur subunit A n=1 Tax=candidate division MSBL1 archaeon SCGC-AAA259D14 TaxID=1698261 RepID=A0A133U4R0_9EURY|nr:disulfide reductase [candidate division MSBL1 archaeon SCGC-AAA259D14]
MNSYMRRIGVYVCHCGTNIAGTVDVDEVTEFASKLDDVVVAKNYEFMCSDPGKEMIEEDIEEEELTNVVVAACSPTLHEDTFMEVVQSGGLNRFLFQQANIREHCSWVTDDEEEATEKAKRLVNAAVSRVKRHEPLEVREVDVVPRTLVVGGGIAGIEAALDVADSGKEVHLVEKSPSIGGHMAQLDKTFPTLDCSACILTPKMSDVGGDPYINLMTYSEVESVEGYPGNYEVKVKRKPRYVDENKCTGCGICQEKCPATAPSEFDEEIGERKAIYIPFPQAVPQIPVIDKENCIYFEREKCKACELNCPRDAVNFEQEEEIEELDVGNIIIATGYELMDPSVIKRYGYGKYDDVYTALEIERMIDATGPTDGEIITSKGEEPETVVIVHCVGSRDENYNEYCSRVCCMYSMKLAHLIKDETDADVFELYLDLRAFGKGYEEFYNRVREEDIIFVQGKAGAINVEKEKEKLLVDCEDSLLQKRIEIPADMVVLAPAIEPRRDVEETADKFNISRSEDGFFMERHPKLAPVNTVSDGIFLAGACQGPKDIPDSVAQGGFAAEEAIAMIDAEELELEPYISEVDEETCAGCKICIALCPFDAAEFIDEEGVARIEETLCKGCGTCVAACPSGAAHQQGFSDDQITAEIVGVLK